MTVLHPTFPCTLVRSEPFQPVTLASTIDLSTQRISCLSPQKAAPA
jgi:hypothetical protein